MGRRSKYTPETVQAIVEAVELGATLELAAGCAGISYESLRTYRERYPAFAAALKKAESASARRSLAVVAAETSWQAHAWRLERRHGYVKAEPAPAERADETTLATIAAQYGITVEELTAALAEGLRGKG